MKKSQMTVCFVAVISVGAMCGALQAQDYFFLAGTEHKDITTYYWQGYLFESSSVNILSGGNMDELYAYENSTVNVSSGYVGRFGTYDTSTVDIAGGNIGVLTVGNLRYYGPQRVNITGGQVGTLIPKIELQGNEHLSYVADLSLSDFAAYGLQAGTGTVNSIQTWITSNGTSTVDVTGGVVRLEVANLRLNGPQRVTVTGGTAASMYNEIALEGNEHLTYAADLSLSEWANYGVQALADHVGTISTNITARNTSHAAISGGNLSIVRAEGGSKVDMSGGSVSQLDTYNNSVATISNGSVSVLQANDISTMSITGGTIQQQLIAKDDSIVNLVGGSVSSLFAVENSHVNISGDVVNGELSAQYESTVNISGGTINKLYAYQSSSIILHGYDFVLGSGLSWGSDGQTILGRGLLSGKWFGGTETWTINIFLHADTATIMAIPEPATLALLTLGGLGLLHRRRV